MQSDPFKIQHGAVSDRYVTGYRGRVHEGDNMLFLPFFSGWLGKSLRDKQLSLFYIILIVLVSSLVIRVAYIQGIQGERYMLIADENRLKHIPIQAPRGIIYDRFERPLVENQPRFALYINPILIQSEEYARTLREYLVSRFPEKSADIERVVYSKEPHRAEFLLLDNMDYTAALSLIIDSSKYAALQVAIEPARRYLFEAGLGHILGYIGKVSEDELLANKDYAFYDSVGKNGIEMQYENVLRGTDGSVTVQVDALGRESGVVSRNQPHRGADLLLTLDLDLQKKMSEILANTIGLHGKSAGAGILLDPINGELLAAVSYPSYESNFFNPPLSSEKFEEQISNPDKPLFSRALAGEYPPGSTFKITVSAAALNEGFIDDRYSVMSSGGLNLGNRFFPDWKQRGHGLTNIYKALAESVNTFFYIVGGGSEEKPGLGIETLARYARSMGFGARTGVDVPGESAGFVPTREWKESSGERWYIGDSYNVSIGQGSLLVTPLQLAHNMNYIAGDLASIHTPHIVKNIRTSEGKELGVKVSSKANSISESVRTIIRAGMRQTVTAGTAQSLASSEYKVAGKTGSAQFNRNKQPHSWFVGFAPYESPDVIAVFLIEEGGDENLATIAAREFFQWYFHAYEKSANS